jgi:hypothetical protein
MFLKNIGLLLLEYMGLYPRRQNYSQPSLWEPQILQIVLFLSTMTSIVPSPPLHMWDVLQWMAVVVWKISHNSWLVVYWLSSTEHCPLWDLWRYVVYCTLAGLWSNSYQTNSVALSPQVNYTDWATATCRRNLVPTIVDRWVSRGQRGGSPTVVNLGFLDRSNSYHCT